MRTANPRHRPRRSSAANLAAGYGDILCDAQSGETGLNILKFGHA